MIPVDMNLTINTYGARSHKWCAGPEIPKLGAWNFIESGWREAPLSQEVSLGREHGFSSLRAREAALGEVAKVTAVVFGIIEHGSYAEAMEHPKLYCYYHEHSNAPWTSRRTPGGFCVPHFCLIDSSLRTNSLRILAKSRIRRSRVSGLQRPRA